MTQGRRFQFSVTTALAFTLVAGAFVGANIVEYESDQVAIVKEYDISGDPKTVIIRRWRHHGIPATFVDYIDDGFDYRRYYWNYWAMAWNCVVLILTLAGMWIVLERPGRKASP
jgi:hypothetical protein